MAQYRLVAGLHIQADHEWKPTEQEKTLAERQGRLLKAPSRTYSPGDVVESDEDLVVKFGQSKFQYVQSPGMRSAGKPTKASGADKLKQHQQENHTEGDPSVEQIMAGSKAPDGQIGTGIPEAINTAGPAKEGPISDKGAETLGQKTPPAKPQQGDKPQQTPAHTTPPATTKTPLPNNFNTMSVNEMREWANDEEIEIPANAKTRDEVMKAVRKGAGH